MAKEKKENKQVHPYMDNLEKFNGKIVEVTNVLGDKIRGTCLGLDKQHLNIIIQNEEGIFLIKNINYVRRDNED